MIVVVTGRIGSGKSAVGGMLEKRGANLIEADKIGHELLRISEIKDELIKGFGSEILGRGGIDREKLADTAFTSTTNVKKLNRIMHSRLREEIMKRIEKGINVVVASLYYELGLDKVKDFTVLVVSDVSRSDHAKRQKYIKEVRDFDFKIDNNGRLEELWKKVDALWGKLSILEHSIR